jgi:hypothetical protein
MSRRLTLAATLAGCLFFTAAPAQAEADARTFLQRIDAGGPDGEMWAQILNAYANGIAWANTHIGQNERPKMYCQPANLAITARQNVDILRRYVERDPAIADAPAGLAMLRTLQATFPCPSQGAGL